MGTLRIVAGALRGRRIRVPDLPGLRPTPDRVREALFSILGGVLEGLDVLDAFAGTGALGFEALSRGAARVIFVEAEPVAAREIARTATELGLADRSRVVEGKVADVLARAGAIGPFDLVLADPPYGSGEGGRLLEALARAGAVREGGRVVVERDRRDLTPAAPSTMVPAGTRAYGRACLDFFVAGPGPRGTPTP